MAQAASVHTPARTTPKRSKGMPERTLAKLMVAPSMILMAIVAAWPIIYAIWLSLHEYSVRVAGLSRWALIGRVVIPSVLPALFTGVRIASSIALVLAVSAELITGAPGLGKLIVDAQGATKISLSYAGVLVTGIVGFLLNLVFTTLDRRLLPWSVATREEAA